MESQFGLANVWTQGDFVTRAVALLLLGMSLASWIVILVKALDIIKYKKHASAVQTFWHSEDFAAGLTRLGSDPSNPFRQLALEGREATTHHRNTKGQLHDSLDISDWITGSLRNCIDGCNRAWRSSPRWVPRHPSSACSARSGAFTTHCWPSAPRASPPSTRWPAPSAKPSS
jgi:hypothetical protein